MNKKTTLACVLLFVMAAGLNGCSKESLVAIGGITGLETAGRILADIEGATDREKALVLAHTLALERERAEATTEQEKERLDAEIERSKFAEAGWETANGISGVLREQVDKGKGVDFKDPVQYIPYALSSILAIFGVKKAREVVKRDRTILSVAGNATPAEGAKIVAKVNGG